MNKEGTIFKRGLFIAMAVLTLFGGIFLFIFLDQVVDQYLITTLDQVSHNIVDDLNLSDDTNNTLNSLRTAYDERPISYDLYFLVILLIALTSSSFTAVKAKRVGYFTIFGYLFIFSLFFMVIMFFIAQFTDYLVLEFMLPLFNDVTLDIPIILHFFDNVNIYALLWFIWLGFLGFVDFRDFNRSVSDRVETFTRGGFKR